MTRRPTIRGFLTHPTTRASLIGFIIGGCVAASYLIGRIT